MTISIDNEGKVIGYVIGGNLKDSLRARLTVESQEVQEGEFFVIESGHWQYYGLVTDLELGATDPRFADEQSEQRLPGGLARLLHGQTLYTNMELMPALMLEVGPPPESDEYETWRTTHIDDPHPVPVKTIPAHHADVKLATAGHIAKIFGEENHDNFVVGYTREQLHPVCIDLKKFVQRSSGIFGATGTGKSFLTRIILTGLIKQDKTSLLLFDMHNEYGYDDTASDSKQRVVGLKTKFPANVRVVGLGAGAMIRGQPPDYNLMLAEKDIQPEDIELLTRELNLKETTPTTLDALVHTFGRENWYHEFKKMRSGSIIETDEGKSIPAPDSVAAWANEQGVNVTAAEGLWNKLRQVFNKPYVIEHPPVDSLSEIILMLEKGLHVILSFSNHTGDLDYLLVTNLLTRRIRDAWEKRTNDFRSNNKNEPRPLVIVVEEAHKLLNRDMASQTIFSTIAREMRKYYVTLIIIDQRPSQIYDEVLSQLGTRISGWLGDEDDIHAVLAGLAGRDALRGMLARLQPKEEVLLLGWGMNMPIPVRSRRYDDMFWREILGKQEKRSFEQNIKDLGF